MNLHISLSNSVNHHEVAVSWYAGMRAVRCGDLRCRLKILTWQELASVLPAELQDLLEVKYGITHRADLSFSEMLIGAMTVLVKHPHLPALIRL